MSEHRVTPFDWRFAPAAGDETGLVLQTSVDAGSPVFAGHFPGDPVVPGVCLLDMVDRAARTAGLASGPAAAVDRARFGAVTRPGDRLVVHLSGAGDTVNAVVRGNDGERCRARLRYRSTPWT